VKKRQLTPWFHEAARHLGLRYDDHDRRAPTYPGDGRVCIARLKKLEDVVHELAHFIDAIPARRCQPNFGLGTDPDGGPVRPYEGMLDKASGDLIETCTTFLTFMLLVDADLPWRRNPSLKHWSEAASPEEEDDLVARVTFCRHHFKVRGIDIWDPLAHFRAGDPNR